MEEIKPIDLKDDEVEEQDKELLMLFSVHFGHFKEKTTDFQIFSCSSVSKRFFTTYIKEVNLVSLAMSEINENEYDLLFLVFPQSGDHKTTSFSRNTFGVNILDLVELRKRKKTKPKTVH